MVSEREIEMAIKAFQIAHTAKVNIPLEQSMRAALEAAARVRAENDAFQDAVETGLGAVKINADGTTEWVDLRAEEPVAYHFRYEDPEHGAFEFFDMTPNPPQKFTSQQALYASPQPSGWRPIETAPKDGTPIITCVAGFEPMVSARWIEYEGKAMFSEDPDTFMKEEHFGEYFHNVSYYPTHWMPLPTPPKAGGEDD